MASIPQVIKDLSNDDLRFVIKSLQNITWDEDHKLRQLATAVHEEDTVVTMLALAVPLAMELEERTAPVIRLETEYKDNVKGFIVKVSRVEGDNVHFYQEREDGSVGLSSRQTTIEKFLNKFSLVDPEKPYI